MCIGDEARKLTRGREEYFKISPYEVSILREEIINGDETYKKSLDLLNEAMSNYKAQKSFENLINLLDATVKVRRFFDVKKYLKKLKGTLDEEDEAGIFYAYYFGQMLTNIDFFVYEKEINKDEILEALRLFEDYEEKNKILGVFDPVSYVSLWISSIDKYINTYVERTGFGVLSINKEDKESWELIKKHDELILGITPYQIKPNSFLLEPFLKGNKILRNRLLLNLDFPEKLEYLTLFNLEFSNFSAENEEEIFPLDNRNYVNRLLSEFPQFEELILIKNAEFLGGLSKKTWNIIYEDLEPIYQKIKHGHKIKTPEWETDLEEDCIFYLFEALIEGGQLEKAYNMAIESLRLISPQKVLSFLLEFEKVEAYSFVIEYAEKVLEKKRWENNNLERSSLIQIIRELAEAYKETEAKEKIKNLFVFFEKEISGLNSEMPLYQELKRLQKGKEI